MGGRGWLMGEGGSCWVEKVVGNGYALEKQTNVINER